MATKNTIAKLLRSSIVEYHKLHEGDWWDNDPRNPVNDTGEDPEEEQDAEDAAGEEKYERQRDDRMNK